MNDYKVSPKPEAPGLAKQAPREEQGEGDSTQLRVVDPASTATSSNGSSGPELPPDGCVSVNTDPVAPPASEHHQDLSETTSNEGGSAPRRPPLNPLWTYLTEGLLHKAIQKVIRTLGTHAARHPYTYIITISVLSFSLAGIGLATNFVTEFDQRVFLTPTNSFADLNSRWIDNDSGFEKLRVLWLAIHSHGDNILHAQAMRQALLTMETIRSAPDFDKVCSQSQFRTFDTNEHTCRIFTVTAFWNDNVTLFDHQMATKSTAAERDELVRDTVSRRVFPDGTPVFPEIILGNYNSSAGEIIPSLSSIRESLENGTTRDDWHIYSAQSLVIKMDIPDLGPESDPLEHQLLDRLKVLQHSFESEPQKYGDYDVRLEFFTLNAYQQEFQRAMNQDVPLVLVLAAVMISFTCLVFYRHKQIVKSRGMLGLFAFATIGMSLLSGYGIMFLAGVPLTSVGIMIPFLIVGIALDDTFIITGAFFRRMRVASEGDDVVTVIGETLEEVGVSISMTTMTTLLCFIISSATTLPAIRWLCYYAFTTIGVDFIYQVTFFIALLALDERRVQGNRRDFCFWIVVQDECSGGNEADDTDEDDQKVLADRVESVKVDIALDNDGPLKGLEADGDGNNGNPLEQPLSQPLTPLEEEEAIANSLAQAETQSQSAHIHHELDLDRNFVERFMIWYANHLLTPWVKVLVILAFSAYFAGCVYSTTLLHQEFNVGDYVPKDSFLTSFMENFKTLTTVQRYVGVYFRDVDQSDPDIQKQMSQYIESLSEMPQIGEPPAFYWVRDFAQIASSGVAASYSQDIGIDISNFTFNKQLDIALSIPPIRQIYAQDIVRDESSGNITASRAYLYFRKVNMYDIKDQIATLKTQSDITLAQPINQQGGELAFFTFDDMYFFWEMYSTLVDQLIFNTVQSVVVVNVVAFVCIPHWSAVTFTLPLIIMLYFDLLGTMQYCGITINPISYFIIVMSIGLLVDFLMHILLRYYESKGNTRHAKVKETLVDIGSSIFCGGFTTWLSVLPLAFSTTKTFMTVFVSFLAMVSLGIAVGLALLPVLLSIVGPMPRPAGIVPSNTETRRPVSVEDN